ncbi:MAG: hypothetical protein K0S71_2504 [Clostridia bacterium]|jgi:hypothetical protein|nr:hypothetical protein [Clostridia bacterium]
MKNTKKGEAELQSKLDHAENALNADNGFKTNGNSAVQPGAGNTKNKR